MDYGQTNLRWAKAFIDGLAAGGVRHIVVSPGSRSTPLILACTDRHDLKVWVLPDERSAAFFALGLGKGGQEPAAVIGTSGTAPANWYPAVIEAAHDFQPLILVSADRPAELQDSGANQTIDQTRLFGTHVRAFVALPHAEMSEQALRYVGSVGMRSVDQCCWPVPGPVHINVPLREPLVSTDALPASDTGTDQSINIDYPRLAPSRKEVTALATWLGGRRGVIVCGRGNYDSDFATAVTALARQVACPIFADPLSGLRTGEHDRSHVIVHYDAFLRRPQFVKSNRADWILQFGGVPTSKALQQYLDKLSTGNIAVVVPHGPWPDPQHRAGRVLHVDPTLLCRQLGAADITSTPPAWTDGFLSEERRARETITRYENDLPLEATVLQQLMRSSPGNTVVFGGNSMVMRDLDSFFSGSAHALRLLGNRGTSGIDGNVSTVLGIAAATDDPVVGLLGDLALYHDMNGLIAAKGLSATLVVFNNDGGAIFGYLPQEQLPDFERYWLTPSGLDFAQVAKLYGLRHWRVHNAHAFDTALVKSLEGTGVGLIEVVVDREDSLKRHRLYWRRIAEG
ncbi:MAG: 2-succinyl-5-enolpyruvyl-6-hydroxy-3-cyclohexene-1-carboxylic-acid synthase [Acidiferrobacterales bacterium]